MYCYYYIQQEYDVHHHPLGNTDSDGRWYSLHPPDARNRSTKIVAAKVSESGGMLYSLSRESTCSSLTVDSKPPELLVPVSITRVLLLLILVISVISAIYTYSGMRTLQPHPSQLYVRRQEELASSTAA